MSNRVDPDEVREIIETEVDNSDLLAFITAANLVVTERLGGSTALTDAQRKEIERWLAAHFLASTREQQAQSEGVNGISVTYQGQTGKGLDSTHYGQMVKMLDSTGTLAGAGGGSPVLAAVTSFS